MTQNESDATSNDALDNQLDNSESLEKIFHKLSEVKTGIKELIENSKNNSEFHFTVDEFAERVCRTSYCKANTEGIGELIKVQTRSVCCLQISTMTFRGML